MKFTPLVTLTTLAVLPASTLAFTVSSLSFANHPDTNGVLARSLATLTDLTRRQQSPSPTDSVNELMFSISLPEFNSRRDVQSPPEFQWQSDDCTSAPDTPFGFDFRPACHRHDFGYHNFRAQARFTESNKALIDAQFLRDLKYLCGFEGFFTRGPCEATAEVYYAAVKEFGGDDAAPGKRAVITL